MPLWAFWYVWVVAFKDSLNCNQFPFYHIVTMQASKNFIFVYNLCGTHNLFRTKKAATLFCKLPLYSCVYERPSVFLKHVFIGRKSNFQLLKWKLLSDKTTHRYKCAVSMWNWLLHKWLQQETFCTECEESLKYWNPLFVSN